MTKKNLAICSSVFGLCLCTAFGVTKLIGLQAEQGTGLSEPKPLVAVVTEPEPGTKPQEQSSPVENVIQEVGEPTIKEQQKTVSNPSQPSATARVIVKEIKEANGPQPIANPKPKVSDIIEPIKSNMSPSEFKTLLTNPNDNILLGIGNADVAGNVAISVVNMRSNELIRPSSVQDVRDKLATRTWKSVEVTKVKRDDNGRIISATIQPEYNN